MPRQFATSDREEVVDVIDSLTFVYEATGCGPGVMALLNSDVEGPNNFTGLTEKHGWYVDKYETHETGDRVVAMPITEVPE